MKLELAILLGLALGYAHELLPRDLPRRAIVSRTIEETGRSRTTRTRPQIELTDKANRAADATEREAALMRLNYHSTAKSFQHKYSSAVSKYTADKKDPAVRPEKLYEGHKEANKLFKKVGRSQKDLANAYAKASIAADEAGRDDRVVRNSKKAQATAAHFYATKAIYKTAKDSLKAEHLPDIATRVRTRAKPGSSEKAARIRADAKSAAERSRLNDYTMHMTTKRYRELRVDGGRDTASESSDVSQE